MVETKESLLTESGVKFEQLTPKWQIRILRKEGQIVKMFKVVKMAEANNKYKPDKKDEILAKYAKQIEDIQEEIAEDTLNAISEFEVDNESATNTEADAKAKAEADAKAKAEADAKAKAESDAKGQKRSIFTIFKRN